MMIELSREKERRIRAEFKIEQLRLKLQESQAFQTTMTSYMHNSRGANSRAQSASRHQNFMVKTGSDNSTKPSSNIIDSQSKDEPIPSFLKALTCYQTGLSLGEDEDEDEITSEKGPDILNETFSKSSGN